VNVRFARDLEAPRAEWFLAGTAQHEIRTADGRPRPRIVYPGRDSVLALDPDIPARTERVFFQMRPARGDLAWELDGNPLTQAATGWSPRPGRHVLRLVDGERHVLDTVTFAVRGAPETIRRGSDR
jgi:penicillin-binding protein 1C